MEKKDAQAPDLKLLDNCIKIIQILDIDAEQGKMSLQLV